MDITGLTGHSGSGKTTVASMLVSKGFYHIDCDKLVHENVYTDITVLEQLTKVFGNEFVTNKQLERKKLGALVFSDKSAYDKLMEIIEPFIKKALEIEINRHKNLKILLDAPTLFEFSMQNMCNRIIGVVSNHSLERICDRDNISIDYAKKRLENQKNADFYKEKCDYLIENNGSLIELEKQVENIANDILKGSSI